MSADGSRSFHEPDLSGLPASIDEETLDASFTDNHLVSWQEVVKGGQHRLIGERCAHFLCATESYLLIDSPVLLVPACSDITWLQNEMRDEFPSEPTWLMNVAMQGTKQETTKVYQSLDRVYLDLERKLIRADEDTFEKLITACPGVNVSKLLAVDYVAHMLVHVADEKIQGAVDWLFSTPQAWNMRSAVDSYFKYYNVASEGVHNLIDVWKKGEPTETSQIIDDLIGPTIRMQVFRISDSSAGVDINKFIGTARKELGLVDKFELLADFKDLEIKKGMSREWWETFQHGKCQHLIGTTKKECKCQKYGAPDKVALERLECRDLPLSCSSCLAHAFAGSCCFSGVCSGERVVQE